MNIYKSFVIEHKKAKRRGIGIVIALLLLLLGLYSSWGINRPDNLAHGRIMQLYQIPLINSLLLPTVMAYLASRLSDSEHSGNTWKLLFTIQSKSSIFCGKILYGLFCIFTMSLALTAIMLINGKIFHFEGTADYPAYILFFLNTLCVSFVLFLLQFILSIVFQNQAVALSVGLCGSMAGLFLLYLPYRFLWKIIPWGLYGATMFIGMDWNSDTRVVKYYYADPDFSAYAAVIIWILLLLTVGYRLFGRMESEGFHLMLSEKTGMSHFRNTKSLSKKEFHTNTPAELIKLRRSPVWLAAIALPALSAIIGTFNYCMNTGVLQDEWYSLWTQHTLFLCYFFMPPLIGVYCSWLLRLEHSGTNWNQIKVNTSPFKIVKDKMLIACGLTFVTIVWVGILYIMCGKYADLSSPLPAKLIEWLLLGYIGGAAICSMQIFLSIIIRNFALPIAAALAGGIAGLLLSAKGYWYLLPYSVFSLGMRANNPYYELNISVFLSVCVIFIVGFMLLSILYLKKADTKTS